MRLILAFALLFAAGATAPAAADSAARGRAGRAVFDRLVRALADRKLDAFAAQFVDDSRAAAMFPSGRVPAVGRREIRIAADNWAGSGRAVAAVTVVGTPIVGVRPDDSTGKRSDRHVVVTGELEVTVRNAPRPIALRMTSLLVAGLDRANPAALAVVAVFVTEGFDDTALRGEDVVGEDKDIDRFLDLLRFPDILAAHFDAAPDDVVVGSAPKELGRGTDAPKLLARWKDQKVTVVGKPQVVKDPDWMYIMGTVSLARGGKQKPAPLNVLLVGYPECGKSCVGIDMTPHVVAVHYGQPR